MTLEEMEKRLKALEGRVRILEDTEEIKTLMRRYVTSLVLVRWDDVLDCFTDDASVEIGISGRRQGKAAIARLFKEEIGKRHIGKELAFVVHPLISVSGDKARGSWLMHFMFTEATHHQTYAWSQGPYECAYTRVNGKWKISSLKWTQRVGPKPVKLMGIYGVKDA